MEKGENKKKTLQVLFLGWLQYIYNWRRGPIFAYEREKRREITDLLRVCYKVNRMRTKARSEPGEKREVDCRNDLWCCSKPVKKSDAVACFGSYNKQKRAPKKTNQNKNISLEFLAAFEPKRRGDTNQRRWQVIGTFCVSFFLYIRDVEKGNLAGSKR